MKRLVLLVAMLMSAAPAFAQIPALDQVRVEGANPEVLTWPQTSTITEFWIRPGVLHVRYDKQGQWPPVDMGGALQEATVWVFVNVNGVWTATGAERLRPNQIDKPQDPHPSQTIGVSWLYAKDRWPTLAGYAPHDDEIIGFMVAAGSTRSDFHVAVRERTNVVFTRYRADGEHFELVAPAPAPSPAPMIPPAPPEPSPAPAPPAVTPPPAPAPPATPAIDPTQLDRIEHKVDALDVKVTEFRSAVGNAWKTVLKYVAQYGAPVVAGILGGRAMR